MIEPCPAPIPNFSANRAAGSAATLGAVSRPFFCTRRRWIGSAGALVGSGLALGIGPQGGCSSVQADEARLLAEAHSSYNHIVAVEQGSVRTMYFVVDGTYYIESRYDRSHPRSLDLDYTRTMMAGFLIQPRIRSLLMVGFGGGQISNYLFDRLPGLEVDGVDIDPEVIRIAREFFGVPEDPRYRTHAADGRAFIEGSQRQWDMIILDAFRGVVVPEHLKTVEFYGACLECLTPRGVLVANLHDNSGTYADDRATFASVFPTRYAFESEGGGQTSLVASADPRWVGAYEMRANAHALHEVFDFDVLGLAARYHPGRRWQGRGRIAADEAD